MESESKFSVSFCDDFIELLRNVSIELNWICLDPKICLGQKEPPLDNCEPLEDNYDAFNDETFGEIDTTDWESEHEKLMSITGRKTSDPNDNQTNDNLNKRNYHKNTSFYETRTEDDMNYGFEDIISKSISDLGLEDEDFEDPAVMTYARSAKTINANSIRPDQIRRLSRSSPPPPAFISYEEYCSSPKTSSIWSTTQMDSTLPQTVNSISSVNMRTLEDIENDMINQNSDRLSHLSTIKRPINLEELEANLFSDSTNRHIPNNEQRVPEMGWSPFGTHSVDNYTPNGKINSEVVPNLETIEKNMRSEAVSNNSEQIRTGDNINLKAVQMMASEVINEPPIDPLLKAQTLSEIERQLISDQSSPQRVVQNVTNPPQHITGHPVLAASPIHPHAMNMQSMNRPIPHNFAMRFANVAQNRFNNLHNRQPVRQLIPGMVPAIGRTMFSPALIPNSQRIFPYGIQPRPVIHPLLHPLHLQQQQQHIHQQYLQQRQQFLHNSRQSHRYYDDDRNDDEYAGLMTQREKEWLIRIQQMQTELKDPYVDDYYYVTYISRKIAAKAATDKENKTTPSLVLPVRPKPVPEPETPKYIPVQFEGSLGKIQVSNVNCPRKLLDCKLNKTNVGPNETTGDTKPITKSEVQKFRKLLLEIEKLYVVLINIDDEDKRIGALPEEARLPHLETRRQLCDKLFTGITNETKDKINLEVAQIKKGLALIFRSLNYLTDESHKAVIISDLLNAKNFRKELEKFVSEGNMKGYPILFSLP